MAFANACRVLACVATQFVDVVRREVGERIRLEVGPPGFDGVEFRCIRWKEDEPNPRPDENRRAFQDGLVSTELVPNDDDGSAKVPGQRGEEGLGLVRVEVPTREKGVVQPDVSPLRGDGQCADHGDLLSTPSLLVQYRCYSTTRPSATHERCHEKPGFVDEDDVCSQPRGVFFTRGQVFLIQPRIRSSSRSRARRSGF